MGGALIVTWLGGGATQPAIGLGRELSARGHRVRVLAPARFAGRIAAAGCEHAAHPAHRRSDRFADDNVHVVDVTKPS